MKFSALKILGASLLVLASTANAQVQTKPARSDDNRVEAFASGLAVAPNVLDTWSFEAAQGFAPGFIGGQVGWGAFAASTAQASISATGPITGAQSLVIDFDPALASPTNTGAFSPNRGPQVVTDRSRLSVDIRITATGGADYDVVPQAPSQSLLSARVKFLFLGDILILDDTGGGLAFEDSGTDWPVNTVFNLTIDLDPVADTLDYYLDGTLFYSSVAGVIAGTQMEQVVLLSDNFHFGEVGQFDNLVIDTAFSPAADVALSLTSNAPGGSLGVGTQFSYTVSATNDGPGIANDLNFTLTLSGKTSFVSSNCGAVAAGNSVTWNVPTLAAGATTTCTITVAVVAPGDIISNASVTTGTDDPNLANNTADLVVGFVATQVPTLGQLGLLLLGLLLAGSAVVIIRR